MKQQTIGIVGGGQLGRMLCMAANDLNFKTIVLDPTPDSPASFHATKQIVGSFKDQKHINKLAKLSEVLTYEIESANAKALAALKRKGHKISPDPRMLEVIQDKYLQKIFFKKHKISSPKFVKIKSLETLEKDTLTLRYPYILKARFHAYDGRGNYVVKNKKDLKDALKKLKDRELYAEEYINFEKEIAIQVVKDKKNKLNLYPLVETIQKNNICHIVIFPPKLAKKHLAEATKLAKKVVKNLKGAGVFAVEMFYTKDGRVLANEIAPRVHNSGHWTIEGCQTSQFENHIRAVSGLRIESTKPKVKSATMINILGDRNGITRPKGFDKLKKDASIHAHLYDKKETKKERKMGHITVVGNSAKETLKKAIIARRTISI